MNIQFKNAYLEKIYQNKQVAGKPKYNFEVIVKFKKTVLKLQMAGNLREIKASKGLNFEALKGELKGYYSVRVNKGYRLILTVDKEDGIVVTEVLTLHDLNNHYQ